MKTKSIPLFLSLTLLTSCAPYSESFDCPPGKGVGCQSLNKVNQMVEEGQLPLQDSLGQENPSLPRPSREDASFIEARNEPRLKVWMAAYEDAEKIYHDPSYVYVAMNKDQALQGACSSENRSCPLLPKGAGS
jgi:hypothetical protein